MNESHLTPHIEPEDRMDYEPEPIPLCDNILSAYDPERGERLTGVSLTDFRLAEAITQLESMVHRQAHEIKLLQAQLAELTK